MERAGHKRRASSTFVAGTRFTKTLTVTLRLNWFLNLFNSTWSMIGARRSDAIAPLLTWS